MTTTAAVLTELKSLGTEQTRKMWRRHGVTGEIYGVLYGPMNALRKRLKVNHPLALELWATRNHDARVLATMIADPSAADGTLLETWVHDLGNYVITDAVSGYAGRTALAREKAEEWTGDDGEWVGSTGWNVLASVALTDTGLPDDYFRMWLATIERELHGRKNRVRHAMHNTLIAIGMRNDTLAEEAIAAAGRIGKVIVDHGQTGCKTPDAAPYIMKARERQQRKKK